jgi:hypothetical protein
VTCEDPALTVVFVLIVRGGAAAAARPAWRGRQDLLGHAI